MATAKKMAIKTAAKTKKLAAPAKTAKGVIKAPAKKAPVSKTARAVAKLSAKIATLTERKNKIVGDINALKDQRTVLKAASAPAKAKPTAPAKKAKLAAKK